MVDTGPASGPDPELDAGSLRDVRRLIRLIVRLVPFLLDPDPEPDAPAADDAPGDARPGGPLRP
jgi:hypothetical protein